MSPYAWLLKCPNSYCPIAFVLNDLSNSRNSWITGEQSTIMQLLLLETRIRHSGKLVRTLRMWISRGYFHSPLSDLDRRLQGLIKTSTKTTKQKPLFVNSASHCFYAHFLHQQYYYDSFIKSALHANSFILTRQLRFHPPISPLLAQSIILDTRDEPLWTVNPGRVLIVAP